MKKTWLLLMVVVVALACAGCEDDTKEKARQLTFENRSSYVIDIVPLTIEWQGFSLAPNEIVTLKDIDNVDWYFSRPSPSKVQEGSSSQERWVIFVNAIPSEGE
jgi:hypothetical protein